MRPIKAFSSSSRPQERPETPRNAPCCFATLSGRHGEAKTPETQHAESLPTMHHRTAQHAWASGCQTPINYSSALHPLFLLSSMVLASSCILKAEARERRALSAENIVKSITTFFKKTQTVTLNRLRVWKELWWNEIKQPNGRSESKTDQLKRVLECGIFSIKTDCHFCKHFWSMYSDSDQLNK